MIETLFIILWIIDILDIDFVLNGVSVAYFLDYVLPLNTIFWILMWIFVLDRGDK